MKRSSVLIVLFASSCGAAQSPLVQQRTLTLEPPGPLATVPPRPAPLRREATLDNGLRVIVVEHHRRPVVMVRLSFGEGFASDPVGSNGATFFATALLAEWDEDDLLEGKPYRTELENAGAEYEFDVGPDEAWIGINGYARDSASYLDILGRMTARPRHGEEIFAEWRKELTSRQEDLEVDSDPTFYTFLTRAAFDPNHVYSRSPLGSLEELRALGHEQVVAQQAYLLTPARATLLVVGDVSAAEIIAQAQRSFAGWRRNRTKARTRLAAPKVESRKAVIVVPRAESRSMAVCVARPLTDVEGKRAELEVLATLLGYGTGSRLFSVLREQHGLSYSATVAVIERRYARSWIGCTRVPHEASAAAVAHLLATFKQAADAVPASAQIERAKRIAIAAVDDRHESVQHEMTALMEEIELGHDAVTAEQLQAVRAEDVQVLASQIFGARELQLVMAGVPSSAERAVRENNLGAVQRVRSRR